MSRQRSVNDKKHGGTLENNGTLLATTEKVADVLEREMDFVIDDWMEMVQKQKVEYFYAYSQIPFGTTLFTPEYAA